MNRTGKKQLTSNILHLFHRDMQGGKTTHLNQNYSLINRASSNSCQTETKLDQFTSESGWSTAVVVTGLLKIPVVFNISMLILFTRLILQLYMFRNSTNFFLNVSFGFFRNVHAPLLLRRPFVARLPRSMRLKHYFQRSQHIILHERKDEESARKE